MKTRIICIVAALALGASTSFAALTPTGEVTTPEVLTTSDEYRVANGFVDWFCKRTSNIMRDWC